MILPMMALVGLTFVVMFLVVRSRFGAVANRTVDRRYFQLMQGENIPEAIIKTTRNFNNLLEMPVLFYAGAILVHFSDVEPGLSLYLAWGYVLLRTIHTAIHVTYNHPLHRLAAFGLSNICLAALWGDVGLKLA